jgi:glycosyltransferase involved in cell wall biosynthesis
VMAVHNGERFLAEAIESILCQSFRDFEFLIIDDGSVDNSRTILDAYAAQDFRIRLTSQPNRGLTPSLNIALQAAKGEFVARFDADDVSLPKRLEQQLFALQADPNLVLVGSEVELISDEGHYLGARGHATDHREIRKRLLLGDGGALTHPAVMMRQSCVRAISGYDESFPVGQDLDLFLRLSEIGMVRNLPDTLLLRRQHSSSINNTRSNLWMQMKRQAIEKTIKRVGAAKYANDLFYQVERSWTSTDHFALGFFAEQKGRYRTAARLYTRAVRNPTTRRQAIRRLLVLSIVTLKTFIRRSL